jgi:hypothetical protein
MNDVVTFTLLQFAGPAVTFRPSRVARCPQRGIVTCHRTYRYVGRTGELAPMALECGICLESYLEADSFTLSSCGHSHHHPCLIANVAARLTDSGDLSLRCPESGCGITLLDTDISLLSDASVLARLHRVRAQRADPSLRFCACGGEVRGGSARAPQLRCGACGLDFCWLHEARHAPGAAACAAFLERERVDPANAASLAALRGDSKQCPNAACGSGVSRDGGCNSVVCSVCQITFCWLCGEQIEPGELPIHFQWCAFQAAAAPLFLPSGALSRAQPPKIHPHTHTRREPAEPLPLFAVWRGPRAHAAPRGGPPRVHAFLRALLWAARGDPHPRRVPCPPLLLPPSSLAGGAPPQSLPSCLAPTPQR